MRIKLLLVVLLSLLYFLDVIYCKNPTEPRCQIRHAHLVISEKSMRFLNSKDSLSYTLILDKWKKGYLKFQFEIINENSNDTLRLDGNILCDVLYYGDHVDLEFTHDECGPSFLHYDYYTLFDSCEIVFNLGIHNGRVQVIDINRKINEKYPGIGFIKTGTLRRFP